MFITAIFIVVKSWKQHRWRCPPVSPCDTRLGNVILWWLPARPPWLCLPHPLNMSHLNRKCTRCDVTTFISESSFSRMAFLEHSCKWAQKQILDKNSICIHMLYWYHRPAKNSLDFPDSICVAQDQSFPMFSLSSAYYYIMTILYNVLIILHNIESFPHTWAGLLDWFSQGGMRLTAFYRQFVPFIVYPTMFCFDLLRDSSLPCGFWSEVSLEELQQLRDASDEFWQPGNSVFMDDLMWPFLKWEQKHFKTANTEKEDPVWISFGVMGLNCFLILCWTETRQFLYPFSWCKYTT